MILCPTLDARAGVGERETVENPDGLGNIAINGLGQIGPAVLEYRHSRVRAIARAIGRSASDGSPGLLPATPCQMSKEHSVHEAGDSVSAY